MMDLLMPIAGDEPLLAVRPGCLTAGVQRQTGAPQNGVDLPISEREVSAVRAADTTEGFDPGFSDAEVYFAAGGIGRAVDRFVVQDVTVAQNRTTAVRTADAAGIHAVIVPRDRAAHLTPTVRKVASGAAETVPLFTVTNLARTLRSLKDAGIWLYAASDGADQDIYEADLQGPLAFVLGGEGKGLRRLTRELCDHQVVIPMTGQVESLNVSVAAGVLLYEAVRQRREGVSGD